MVKTRPYLAPKCLVLIIYLAMLLSGALAMAAESSATLVIAPSLPVDFGRPWPQKINHAALIKQYQQLEKKFSAQLCPAGTEPKFNKLFEAYLGNGQFIPAERPGVLARDTVRGQLALLQEKLTWINKIQQQWQNFKEQKKLKILLHQLEQELQAILDLRRIVDEGGSAEPLAHQAQKHWSTYQQVGKEIIKLIPFWLSFKFPLDHLALRQQYDELRMKDPVAADQIYLYRRTVQEGAPGGGHFMGPDLALRAGIDTWYLRLIQDDFWPSENDRYDAQFVIDQLHKRLKQKKSKLTALLKQWASNTQEALKFYEELLNQEEQHRGVEWLALKTKARVELENFVAHKRQQIIDFWAKQSPIMQAMYAMDTILFGEVGNLDPSGLERADIAQVVMNRTAFEKYHQLTSSLRSDQESIWLRILFKEGEFSFTYFFIAGSVRTFCFDQTKRGKRLRQENLRIALDALKHPRPNFKATRYFSRGPMLGHLDMAKLWSDYTPYPERPGQEIKDPGLRRKLQTAWRKKKYAYWYTFSDDRGERWQVLKIGPKPYVRAQQDKHAKFYTYRDPQLFRYFVASVVERRWP